VAKREMGGQEGIVGQDREGRPREGCVAKRGVSGQERNGWPREGWVAKKRDRCP
jgi:hypothetical protein